MDATKMARVFKALSNPNRLELFLQIMKKTEASFPTGGCFVCDIIESFNIGAPTISHHLKELSNAGLITTDRQGKFLVCRVNTEILAELKDILTMIRH